MESFLGLGKRVLQDNQVECRRCGFVWTVNAEKRGRKDLLCASCRVKPATMIQYGKLRCSPHQGALDADLNPVDDEGVLVLPGLRICGHRDCVNIAHIVAEML
jgi:hypothetical protein